MKNENDKVIVTFIKEIPVIGEIVQLFTDENSDISSQLDVVKKQLQILSDYQDTIIQEIKNLHRKILFMPIRNEITSRAVDIHSCVKDLNNFLRQPQLKYRQYDIQICGDSIKPGLRFIADLLKEEKNTKVFEEIIETDTFCNGSKIMVMYKYLFSLLVTGCEAVITSEVVTYNRSFMLDECDNSFNDINNHLREIFHRCTFDSCDTIITVLGQTVLNNIDKSSKKIRQNVISTFPWFQFQLFKFLGESKFTMVGNGKMSSVTFNYNATRKFIIVWTPYKTQVNPGISTNGFAYEIETTDFFYKMFTNMNVTTYKESRYFFVTGFGEYNPSVSKTYCGYTVKKLWKTENEKTIITFIGFCFGYFLVCLPALLLCCCLSYCFG